MPVLPNSSLPGITGDASSFGSQASSAINSGLLGSVGLSSASTRQNVAYMFNYSTNTSGPAAILYPNAPANLDWRVRLSLAPNSKYFYNDPAGNSILSPLVMDGGGSSNGIANVIGGLFNTAGSTRIGVVFPYTPQLTVTHIANYEPQKVFHSNYAQYFYNNSEVQAIQIQGDFTVQNVNEGQYLLACIYFFRSVTKMFFGLDPQAGNPPPILYLNGYGQYYLPNVPCVVTSFSHTMPESVDYIDVPEPAVTQKYPKQNPQFTNYRANSTRLPTTSQITIQVQPMYSRLSQSQNFSLNDFARGALINNQNGSASGFGASQSGQYAKGFKTGGFL